MTLYEINAEIANLVDAETGELLDYDRFAELQMERDTKIENMALWVKDLDAEAVAIKREQKALAKRRQRAEKTAERLRKYLSLMLNGERFQTPRCAVSFRKSVGVDIPDEQGFIAWAQTEGYDDFLTYGAPKISKKLVKEYLDRGNEIEGVSLVEKNNIQIK